MAKVKLSAIALRDLKSIHQYISKDAESYADRVVGKIIGRISILETHAMIGKVVPEFEDSSIRELIEAPYRIIYKMKNEREISIARIYHSARLLRKL